MLVESVIGSITLTNGKQPGPDKGDSVSEPLAHLFQGFVNDSFAFLLKLDTSVRRLGRRQETECSAIQMMELQHLERGSVYCRRAVNDVIQAHVGCHVCELARLGSGS